MAKARSKSPSKLHRRLKLQPHHQSLRLAPHGQTSYPALFLLVLVAGALLLLGTMRAQAATITGQGDINVAALVPGDPPSTAPVITSPTPDQVFATAPITVQGTCEAGLIVKIFRNNAFAGSTLCLVTNTFSLQTDLFLERNDIIARHYDALDQAGPDSNLVVVYYRPTTPQPANPGTAGKPSQAGQTVVVPPVVPSDQIILRTNYLFKGIRPDAQFNWDLSVSGGQSPYALTIDWGDQSQDLKSLSKPSDLKLHHTYPRAGVYKIVIRARDTADRAAYLEMVAIVDGVVPTAVGRIDSGTSYGQFYITLLDLWPVYAAAVAAVSAFWLGEVYARRRPLVNRLQRP